MASIRDERLSIISQDGNEVILRVAFTLRQNTAERALAPALRWNCNIHFYSMDSGEEANLVKLFATLLLGPFASQNNPQSFDYKFTKQELDEDPWWQLGYTEDEIRAKITIWPFLQGVSTQVTDNTNTIQAQFG